MPEFDGFSIARVQESDIHKLYKLDAEIFGPLAYSHFVLSQLFYVHQNLFFLMKKSEQIGGYCLSGFNAGGKSSWVLSLGVAADLRGKGMGRALLERAEKELTLLGSREALLSVEQENDIAIALYKSMDYIEDGLVKDFGGPGIDRLRMIKTLK